MNSEIALLTSYLIVSAALFGLGAIGFIVRRNMIVMFLCAEMMLQGVSLSLVAFSRYHNDLGGQMLVIFIIAVAACEAAIALALILMMVRQRGSLDIVLWQDLRESNQPPHVDEPLLDEPLVEPPQWPELTPAGKTPDPSPEQTDYRPHV